MPRHALTARARRVDGRIIIGDHTEDVWELSPVASSIWQQVDGKRTVAEIASAIETEYDVALEQAVTDVRDFLVELGDVGLIEVSG